MDLIKKIVCFMSKDTFMEFRRWVKSKHSDTGIIAVPLYEEPLDCSIVGSMDMLNNDYDRTDL